MKRIGVIANPKRPHAADVFDRLVRKANELGWKLFADEASAQLIPSATVIGFDQFASTVDVLLPMGGDGTVLFCSKLLDESEIPILGINLGSLGFLTGVSEDSMEAAMDALDAGTCIKETRTVAQCVAPSGTIRRALNDAVIGFGGSSRIVTLDLAIDGAPATSYSCDGLIVCTPTGSTGHSLSTGGPILQPGCSAFGISVVCPHTLSNRPLVIPDSSTIEVTVQNSHKALLLSVDGQDVEELTTGDIVRITRSENPAIFLYPPDYSYFSVLRRKLHWRGSNL
ncbi:NAD(+)/NADH kinase [Tichowtungia aerotolerans]|uniref:NAD kinase n=1 Tax=Tichowtungia aerotolerans TaxID=2697043 RepID=A0A6P1M2A9_9BACT|nr:NAD(+)/NADH kinase [Tichowtungia aerotolerans]QHI67981.1 ATP-NAD kinase [Tichowtungia aerotolerans]